MATSVQRHFGPFFYNGALVDSPLLYHYQPGTTQEKTAWEDYGRNVTAANPIQGDANGLISGYFAGLYKIRVTDRHDRLLAEWDNVEFVDQDALDASGDHVVNVQDVGVNASADGVSDWTSIVSEAVAELTNGSALYFPRGQYRLTIPITIPAGLTGIRIFGDGRGSLITMDSSNDGVFSIGAGCNGLEIDHLKLKNIGALNVLGRGLIYVNPDATPIATQQINVHDMFFAAASTCGISGNFITDSSITRCVFDNDGLPFGEHGVYLGPSGGHSESVDISHCRFRNTASGNSGAITFAGQQYDHLISSNRITGWKYGILINDTAAGSLHDATFRDLRIKSPSHDGIIFFQSDTVEAPTGLEFSDIRITSPGRNGIRSDWVTKTSFADIHVWGAGESGVRMNEMTYCNWSNVVLNDNDNDSAGATGDDSAGLRLNTNCAHNRFADLETRCSNVLVGQSYGVSIGSSGNTDNNFAGHVSGPNRIADFDVHSSATGTWTWADGERCFKLGNPGTTFFGIRSGSGSPEGVVTAPVGALYLRSDGSTSTTLYVKTAGSSSTGWTAK